MSDVMKDAKARPPIDLDEFERQLREMQARSKHPSSDPLAELARIVGQDDPFRLGSGMGSVPAPVAPMLGKAASTAREPAAATPHFDALLANPYSQPADERRMSSSRPVYASPLDELAAIAAVHEAQQETGPPPEFLAVRHDAATEAAGDDHSYAEQPAAYAEPARRSRAGIAIFAGLVVFGLAGVGAVWSLSGPKKGGLLAASDVPVIAPKPGPVKEKPSDPGGIDVPNQKTAVLEKVKDDLKAPSKVLAREEQPVDLSQAAKKDIRRVDLGQAGPTGAPPVTIVSVPTLPAAPASQPAAAAPSGVAKAPESFFKSDAQQTASIAAPAPVASTPPGPVVPTPPAKAIVAAPPENAPSPSVSAPKRVKSIRFNADGEPADTAAPQLATPSVPPVSIPPASAAKTVVVKAAPVSPPVAAPPAAATSPKAAPKQVASRELVKESATPVPAPALDANAPLQLNPPAGVSRKAATTPVKRAAPKPVQTALAAPTSDDAATANQEPAAVSTSAAQPQAARSTSTDGARKFSVQFGAPGSTGEANALISKLKSQYPSVMGSIAPHVIKAEVNGKSFYRVRSGTLSREDANSLCSQLKSAGGACFISGA